MLSWERMDAFRLNEYSEAQGNSLLCTAGMHQGALRLGYEWVSFPHGQAQSVDWGGGGFQAYISLKTKCNCIVSYKCHSIHDDGYFFIELKIQQTITPFQAFKSHKFFHAMQTTFIHSFIQKTHDQLRHHHFQQLQR